VLKITQACQLMGLLQKSQQQGMLAAEWMFSGAPSRSAKGGLVPSEPGPSGPFSPAVCPMNIPRNIFRLAENHSARRLATVLFPSLLDNGPEYRRFLTFTTS